jgi:hypothetical protein
MSYYFITSNLQLYSASQKMSENPVVLVTGAAGGIGYEIVRILLEELSASVVATDLVNGSLEQLSKKYPGRLEIKLGDIVEVAKFRDSKNGRFADVDILAHDFRNRCCNCYPEVWKTNGCLPQCGCHRTLSSHGRLISGEMVKSVSHQCTISFTYGKFGTYFSSHCNAHSLNPLPFITPTVVCHIVEVRRTRTPKNQRKSHSDNLGCRSGPSLLRLGILRHVESRGGVSDTAASSGGAEHHGPWNLARALRYEFGGWLTQRHMFVSSLFQTPDITS